MHAEHTKNHRKRFYFLPIRRSNTRKTSSLFFLVFTIVYSLTDRFSVINFFHLQENSRADEFALKLVKDAQREQELEGKVTVLDSSKNIEHYNRLVDVLLEHGPSFNT